MCHYGFSACGKAEPGDPLGSIMRCRRGKGESVIDRECSSCEDSRGKGTAERDSC